MFKIFEDEEEEMEYKASPATKRNAVTLPPPSGQENVRARPRSNRKAAVNAAQQIKGYGRYRTNYR